MVISPQVLNAWIDAIGWTLLHFLWQGAIVGAAYRLAGPLCRSVAARYRLGMGALVLLLACPFATLAWIWPAHAARALAESTALPTMTVGGEALSVPFFTAAGVEALLPWLVAAWFLGALVIAVRAFGHWRRLNWLVRHASIPLVDCSDVLDTLCRRFGIARRIRLLGSFKIDTPMLVGWLRPVIVLPISMLSGFTPQQIELIIAHELGHVRRWDYLANLLQVVIETVLFYHPVVHWISRDVRDARESCCDDLVLAVAKGSPVVYANTLADLEQMRHDGVLAAPALAASGGVLLERIRRIVGAQSVLYDPLPRSGAWPIALLAIAGAIAVLRLHNPVPNLAATLRDAPAASVAAISGNPRLVGASAAAASVSPPATAMVSAPPAAAARPLVAPPPAQMAPAAQTAEPVALLRVAKPRIAVAASVPDRLPQVRDIRESLAALPVLPAAPVAPAVVADTALEAPVALQRVQPQYPTHEKIRGITGAVDLQFAIDSSGRVVDITVLRSSPERVFDRVAITALSQWRFAPGAPERRYTQSFAFALGAAPASADPCREVIGSHICRHSVAGPEDEAAGTAINVFR